MANTPLTPLPQDANAKVSYFTDQNGNAVAVRLNADGSFAVTQNGIALPAALGTQLASGSLPVVIASNQGNVPGITDPLLFTMNLILIELRALNRSFQDWTAQGDPRVDLAALPLIG